VASWPEGNLYVFTLDGEQVHSTTVEYDLECSPAVGHQKFFYAAYAEGNISYLDLITGTVRENVVRWDDAPDEDVDPFELVVCGDMLVVLRGLSDARFDDNEPPVERPCDGIYVFDLGDYSQKHFFQGSYRTLIKATDDENTVLAIRGCNVEVLTLSGGYLSCTHSFTLPGKGYGMRLVFQSHAYVSLRGRRIGVFNIFNGRLVRTIDVTYGLLGQASTNGRELFFAGAQNHMQGPVVYAHSLQSY